LQIHALLPHPPRRQAGVGLRVVADAAGEELVQAGEVFVGGSVGAFRRIETAGDGFVDAHESALEDVARDGHARKSAGVFVRRKRPPTRTGIRTVPADAAAFRPYAGALRDDVAVSVPAFVDDIVRLRLDDGQLRVVP